MNVAAIGRIVRVRSGDFRGERAGIITRVHDDGTVDVQPFASFTADPLEGLRGYGRIALLQEDQGEAVGQQTYAFWPPRA